MTADPAGVEAAGGTAGEDRAFLAELPDRVLVDRVAAVLATPPADTVDSFVLHAPLELMARAELLPLVAPSVRGEARSRIARIAEDWAAAGAAVPEPEPASPSGSALADAIGRGSLDETDRLAAALADAGSVAGFVAATAPLVLTHLGGAAHGAIFLDQLARLPRPGPRWLRTSRALLRDLARHPRWRLGWVDRDRSAPPSERTLAEVLADPPHAGDPGSTSIWPTMHLVDSSGLAAELLAGPVATTDVATARRHLLRIAAAAMVQDDPAHAPYGWSHCLTMPQATLAIADSVGDPQRAVAVAATYVLGFRSTLSAVGVDPERRPAPPRSSGTTVVDRAPSDAAAVAWHAEHVPTLVTELASFAAVHPDAHLAKYTLACLHAAHDDPAAGPLFRAAAAYLAAWWREHDA